MPRFVHVDHSLSCMGGHEFEYAVNILRTAESAGFPVTLATNQRFRDRSGLPARWPVYPVFPFTAHTKHCVSLGGLGSFPIGLDGDRLAVADSAASVGAASVGAASVSAVQQAITSGIRRLCDARRRTSARRRIRGFAKACDRLFQQVRLRKGDHVFFATLTEFDLLGLANYLAASPPFRRASWHLQFHFDFLSGCGSDHTEVQRRQMAVRQQLAHSLEQLSSSEIHCYATTEELMDQFNRLGVVEFGHLPFPVNPVLAASRRQSGGRLRVTCAGGMRREKGSHELSAMVSALRADRCFDGRIEVAAQVSKEGLGRRVPPRGSCADRADVPFRHLSHPLRLEAYSDMIRKTDIGLFLYDRRRYRVRCSGILQEMLAAGKPVIVPAGCWMAEQIAEPIFRHVEMLRQGLTRVRQVGSRDIQWLRTSGRDQTAAPHGDCLFFTDSERLETELSIPESATECVVAFQWVGSGDLHTHASVHVDQLDRDGNSIEKFESILGRRRNGSRVLTVVHLRPQAVQLVLKFQNAYGCQRLTVADVELDFLDAGEKGGCPAGSVGLIAARHEQVPELLREMVEHYPHYRDSAEAFSVPWREAHHPARTIEVVTGQTAISSSWGTVRQVA